MEKPNSPKKIRKRIPQETKIRARLQQEIDSACPLCDNTEVGHFQIHHIDENPQNNEVSNLLLICPTCHSQISKGDITRDKVEVTKSRLPGNKIEFVAVTVDSKNCSWTAYDNITNAFQDHESPRSPFPILDFSLINHTKRTIVFTAVHLRAKHLYSGLSGIPRPGVLKSVIKYTLPIPNKEEELNFMVDEQIEIPAEQAFRFQVELFEKGMMNNAKYEIQGRVVLYFTFKFGESLSVKIPDIFLNCKGDDEKVKVGFLS